MKKNISIIITLLIFIPFMGKTQDIQLEVTTVQNGSIIDLDSFASGMYLLEITLTNGVVQRTQIVKE